MLEPALLPLTPSDALDDQNSALNMRDPLKTSHVNPLHSPPDHTDLLAEEPSQDFSLGLSAEDDTNTFNLNLFTQDLLDTMEGSPCPHPENPPNFHADHHSCDSTPSSFTPFLEGNTQDLLSSPPSGFLFDEENIEDEDGFQSPLDDLIDDAAILDDFGLLDLALEEGFSPEMAASLDEAGYLYQETPQQETGDNHHSGSGMMVTEDQGHENKYKRGK